MCNGYWLWVRKVLGIVISEEEGTFVVMYFSINLYKKKKKMNGDYLIQTIRKFGVSRFSKSRNIQTTLYLILIFNYN